MKKLKAVVLGLVCVILACASLVGCGEAEQGDFIEDTALTHYDYSDGDGSQYNTNLFYKNILEIGLGDPAVLYVDGWFYITGTTNGSTGYNMWKTQDFTNYIDLGECYTKPSNHFGISSFWAPQLMYDPTADWQYYLGESAGEGQGLYIITFSARTDETKQPELKGGCRLSIAFSKTPEGPYINFEGTNADGKVMTAYDPVFVPETLKNIDFSAWESAHPRYGKIYKEHRAQIDACPFIDPVTGEKYLYFVRTRSPGGDRSNDIWAVKMKDWVTPIYETTTPLTSHGFTTVDQTEKYTYQPNGRIDEGPFPVYDAETGKYILTLSLGDTNDKFYPVAMAVGDTPLGPFTKIQPEDDGLIDKIEFDWDIHGSGHHCFFMVEDEMWIGYHSYEILGAYGIGSRFFSCDKVQWTKNALGQKVMHVNGPTNMMQPLPEDVSGYKNVAPLASVSATSVASGSDEALLNDELRASNDEDVVKDFEVKGSGTTITLSFDEFVTARAILIYQSYDYMKIFENIEKVEFTYRKEIDGKMMTGKAIIDDLGFNLDANLVPLDYLGVDYEDQITGNYDPELLVVRPSTAAIAEFDELEINKVTITVKKAKGKAGLKISDIVILGKTQ